MFNEKNWFYFNEKTCSDVCPFGTYPKDRTNKICEKCNENCETCSGFGEGDCLTCDKCGIHSSKMWHYKNDLTCSKSCPIGTFNSDSLNKKCTECHSDCQSCNGYGDHNCLTCKTSEILSVKQWHFQEDKTCSFACPKGTYAADDSSKECLKCNESCDSCLGPGDRNCTSCDRCGIISSKIWYHVLDKTCLNICPFGYFEDYKNFDCKKCDSPCADCEMNSTFCVKCYPDDFFLENTCLVHCPVTNFYENLCDSTCSKCNYSCIKCRGPSANECDSCADGFFLYNQSCLRMCPFGYFEIKEYSICEQCDLNCADCENNSKNCVECSNGKFLYDNKCLENCPIHFYGDCLNNTCYACNNSCDSCFGPSIEECYSCKSPYYLEGNTCKRFCSPGKFGDDSNRLCSPCHLTCKTCTGPLETNCLTCFKGTFLNANKTCLSNCPKRQFGLEDGNNSTGPTCQDCHGDCAQCIGPLDSNCTHCFDLKMLENGKCVCPVGYNYNGTCLDCHPNCYNCTGPKDTDCGACVEPMTKNNGTCSCSTGYVMLWNKICTKCHYSCENCKGEESYECSSCSTESTLRNLIDNECRCPKFTVDIENEAKCKIITSSEDCTAGCLNCTYPDICLACKQGLILSTDNKTCNCPSGFFFDLNAVECRACHISCKECLAADRWSCFGSCSSSSRGNEKTKPIQGECSCKEGFEEIFSKDCKEKEKLLESVEVAQSVASKSAGATSSAAAITGSANGGGMAVLGILEISQIMSLSVKIRTEFPLSLDKTYLSSLSSLRLDNIFPQEQRNSNSSQRILLSRNETARTGGGGAEVKNIVFTLGLDFLAFVPILLLSLLLHFTKNFNLRKFFKRVLALVRWRLLFLVFRITSVAQLFFAFSELRSSSGDSFVGFSSLAWAIILLVFHIIHFLFILGTINLRNFEIEENKEKFGFLVEGVENFLFIKRNFAVLSDLRKITLCLIYALAFDKPALVTILLIVCQTVFLLYVILLKPLSNRIHLTVLLAVESLLLAFFIVLAVLTRNEDPDVRMIVGWVLITLILITQVFMLLVSLASFVLIVKAVFTKKDSHCATDQKRKSFQSAGGNFNAKDKYQTYEANGMQTIVLGDRVKNTRAENKEFELPIYKAFVLKDEGLIHQNSDDSSVDPMKDSTRREHSPELSNEKLTSNVRKSQKKSLVSVLAQRKSISNQEKKEYDNSYRKSVVESFKKEYRERASRLSKTAAVDSRLKQSGDEDFVGRLIIEENNRRQNKEDLDNFHKKIEMAEFNDPEEEIVDPREYPCEAVMNKGTVVKNKSGLFFLDEGTVVVVNKVFFEISVAEISCEEGVGIVDLECLAFQDE